MIEDDNLLTGVKERNVDTGEENYMMFSSPAIASWELAGPAGHLALDRLHYLLACGIGFLADSAYNRNEQTCDETKTTKEKRYLAPGVLRGFREHSEGSNDWRLEGLVDSTCMHFGLRYFFRLLLNYVLNNKPEICSSL